MKSEERADLLGLLERELVLAAGLEVVESHEELRVLVVGGRQEVFPRRPPLQRSVEQRKSGSERSRKVPDAASDVIGGTGKVWQRSVL